MAETDDVAGKLHIEDAQVREGAFSWAETKPGLWRTTDGRYAIVRTTLPEDRPEPTQTYTLRKIDPALACANPGRLGYFIVERYSLSEVQQAAENDAYTDEHRAETSIPETYPALALARFFWPISNGVTRGALAITCDGDRTSARVIGMSRRVDAYEPGTYAQIDLTGIFSAQ